MFCIKCGTELPEDATFCIKCGAKQQQVPQQKAASPDTIASAETKELKCPSCGAPISPKFGEMVITCEYCGASITFESAGWKNIQKHTMLLPKIVEKDQVAENLKKMMDKGFLHRHLQESSNLEELTLSMIPYWVIPVAARTSIVATDATAEIGNIATTAALMGVMGGMAGGFGGSRRGGFGTGMFNGMLMGGMMGNMTGGMGANTKKSYTMDETYNFPVIALKALIGYQPQDYQFALDERVLFDPKKIPKGIKILNGDINEDAAKYEAKALVDQLQSQRAHTKYHMIQQINTEEDVSDGELLHVPIWFARYDHKGKKIILVVDGNSGGAVHSIGL